VNKNKKFSETLRGWRVAHNWRQERAAQELGVGRSYYSQLENGREPGSFLIERFNAIEKRPVHSVRESEPSSSVLREDSPIYNATSLSQKLRYIPVVSWAQAGQSTSFEEIPKDWQKTVATDIKDKDSFAVEIVGDSMEPHYRSGEIAILLPNSEPRNGDLVVAKLKDDGVCFKIYHCKGTSQIILTSYHPAYPPQEHSAGNFHWI
jgi:SOS-response transcriptional repressor LexA